MLIPAGGGGKDSCISGMNSCFPPRAKGLLLPLCYFSMLQCEIVLNDEELYLNAIVFFLIV